MTKSHYTFGAYLIIACGNMPNTFFNSDTILNLAERLDPQAPYYVGWVQQ